MARLPLSKRIRQGLFILDGAMGTQLIAHGVEPCGSNDCLSVESPHIILEIHRAYLRAGSDAVLTNTFGANTYALARHGLADKTRRINETGAHIARQAAGKDKYVLGDIGPAGDFLQPLGSLQPEKLKEAFAEQAEGLLSGGVDGFIIETMTALDEAKIAVEAVQSVCDLPVLVSLAFDRAGGDYRTMMGVDVKTAVAELIPMGVTAVGFNCGKATLDEYVELAEKFVLEVRAISSDTLISAEPNAGKPELINGQAVYNVSPEAFAAAARKIHSAGVSIIGGCCGTGPEHIEALVGKISTLNGGD